MNSNALVADTLRAQHDSTPLLTGNATKVLEARYLKKNEDGECIEKPAELFQRVAKTIAWRNVLQVFVAQMKIDPNDRSVTVTAPGASLTW